MQMPSALDVKNMRIRGHEKKEELKGDHVDTWDSFKGFEIPLLGIEDG